MAVSTGLSAMLTFPWANQIQAAVAARLRDRSVASRTSNAFDNPIDPPDLRLAAAR